MNWQIVGVLTGFATLLLAIIGQTMFAAFWAGKFTFQLEALTEQVAKLQSRDDLFVKKEDYLEQVARRNQELADIWKGQNSLRDKFEDCRAKKICEAK